MIPLITLVFKHFSTQVPKSRRRHKTDPNVYIQARDKGPITDYPQTRFKFISRPERRSLPDKMWGRPGKWGHIYFVSPRRAHGHFPRSGNVPKWQNICPETATRSDLRTLALLKSELSSKFAITPHYPRPNNNSCK